MTTTAITNTPTLPALSRPLCQSTSDPPLNLKISSLISNGAIVNAASNEQENPTSRSIVDGLHCSDCSRLAEPPSRCADRQRRPAINIWQHTLIRLSEAPLNAIFDATGVGDCKQQSHGPSNQRCCVRTRHLLYSAFGESIESEEGPTSMICRDAKGIRSPATTTMTTSAQLLYPPSTADWDFSHNAAMPMSIASPR
jgi:hypothetical protein